MSPSPTPVRVRRAPRFARFAIIGGMLGAIATLVLTTMFPVDPSVGLWALFAYFSLFGITAGVVLGIVLALVLDAVSRRRAKAVDAELETVAAPEPAQPAVPAEPAEFAEAPRAEEQGSAEPADDTAEDRPLS